MRSPFTTGFTDAAADELSRALVALSHPARLKILALLAANGELTIGALTERLAPLQQPTISHHVKKLAAAGLVVKRIQNVHAYCKADLKAVNAVASALCPWQAS